MGSLGVPWSLGGPTPHVLLQGGMGGYSNTMNDLSKLLETHTQQNVRLRDQNTEMATRMGSLVGETEKRDLVVAGMQQEAMLQIQLLQHQVSRQPTLLV